MRTQLADGFARLVGDAPSNRLDGLMRTPLRRPLLDAIFWQMPKQVNSSRVAGLHCSVRWKITGRRDGKTDVYDLELREGRCRTRRGGLEAKPLVTITLDGAEFLRLISGRTDPVQAYFKGRLGLSGDIMFAAKLASLFRIPGRRSGESPTTA